MICGLNVFFVKHGGVEERKISMAEKLIGKKEKRVLIHFDCIKHTLLNYHLFPFHFS